ncbi:MAG TPA: lysyl oxidase family protein [Thermoleophilaceae bacterium]|nr:lysyl oxidase family protein [Thermoleophilaceae bacterium]
MRRIHPGRAARAAALAAALAGTIAAGAAAQGGGVAPEPEPEAQPEPAVENPCLGEDARLLCPDLRMKVPADITIDRRTRPGRVLLRSTNSIDSRGEGPASLRGRRDGRKTMAARQVIQRTSGGPLYVSTGARLYFQPIPDQDRYWKMADAARFELWSVDHRNRLVERVRVGPKQNYCLRDLRRTSRMRRSPGREVFPACNQDPRKRAVTLGTSVGWSDIYPWSYHQNWIDVTGVKPGRYAYIHIADPKNGIWEIDEGNNSAHAIVRLPAGRVTGGGRQRTAPADDPRY